MDCTESVEEPGGQSSEVKGTEEKDNCFILPEADSSVLKPPTTNNNEELSQSAMNDQNLNQSEANLRDMSQSDNNPKVISQSEINQKDMNQSETSCHDMSQSNVKNTTNEHDLSNKEPQVISESEKALDTNGINQSESSTQDTNQSESMAQDINQSKSMAQDINQSKSMAQDINQSESMTQDTNHSESMTQDTNHSESMTQDTNHSESMANDINQSESMTQDINQSESMTQDINQSESMTQDTNHSESMTQDINQSESMTQDINQSESMAQDIDQSDLKDTGECEQMNMENKESEPTEEEAPAADSLPRADSSRSDGTSDSLAQQSLCSQQIASKEADKEVMRIEESDLGVYDDDSNLEATDDLDLELEPEILMEELMDNVLRRNGRSAASTRKTCLESALSNIDETEELLEPSSGRARGEEGEATDASENEKRPTTNGWESEVGLTLSRAKLNTPASNSVTTDMTSEIRDLHSRDTTRTLETREAVFRRALTLMSNRCTSVIQRSGDDATMPSTLISVQDAPFGVHPPEYFYIHQRKPSPMAPLRAWRGYHGNVYFEPIAIKSVGKIGDANSEVQAAQLVKYDPLLSVNKHERMRPASTPSARANTRQSINSSGAQRRRQQGPRQMALLDRSSIMTNYNPNFTEDMSWISGHEDTGSLTMRPPSSNNREQKLAANNREKIVKGSVAQRIREQKQAQRNKPEFAVSGDKFTPAYTMSPLLRTQTQYSHSNQRMTMNSPDPHHTVYDHLPPLEQIRASLRHMEHMNSICEPPTSLYARAQPYGHKVTMTEELKPFIKYSPDIRKKYLRQVQYLT